MTLKNYFPLLIVILFLFSCNKDKRPDEPSIPVSPAANYYPPLSGTDWETVKPADLGWDVAKLNDAIEYVRTNNSTAFIILHKGRIVTENYWIGWNANTSSRIFSATKSMVGFMTGLAQEQGKLTVTKKVNDYIPSGWTTATPAQENNITVQHLITMTSGLNSDLSFFTTPGTKWYYNTPAYYKTIDVLEKAYNQTKTDFTRAQLWSKIGMQNSFWDTEPSGGVTMSCSGRDMARFGLLIASGGKWNGQPVMNNADYFQAMLNTSQNINPSYGYLWWLNGKNAYVLPSANTATAAEVPGNLIPAAPADLVAALGANDKKIYVVKSKDLVVIRHGGQSNASSSQALSSFDNEIWIRLMQAIK